MSLYQLLQPYEWKKFISWPIYKTGSGSRGGLPSKKLKLVHLQKLNKFGISEFILCNIWIVDKSRVRYVMPLEVHWSCALDNYNSRNMSWVLFRLFVKMLSADSSERIKTQEANQNSSFLDQFNSSENGRTYCQNSNFWNWFFNRKITFVFHSDFKRGQVYIKSSHTR